MSGRRQSRRCTLCGAPTAEGELCDRCAEWATGRHEAMATPPPQARPDGPSSIVLEGKYRLLDELGRGGMGTVFRAVDESLDRMVAVKFLLPEHQAEPSLVKRFRREARAMASVRHENVLQIYSFGSYGTTSFFVMEYIEGQTADEMLMAALGRREYLPLAEVVRLLDQIAAGLAAVHRAGVVHRDVKPGNVMVQADPRRAVVMDFGIGRRYQPGDAKRTLQPGGTPAYMPPEVISGTDIDPATERLSDIYAFGVTAFELLTGSLPFGGESWVQVFQAHLTEAPRAPSSLRLGLPTGLDDLVLRCLAKSPRERFPSCEELRQALAPFVASRPTSPAPAIVRDSPTPGVQARPVSGVRPRVRITVADPDSAFRSLVYEAAEDVFPGCRFQAARSTSSALALARAEPPLVLFAPLEDPELNGLEFAASLWGDTDLRGVKVVLTTERVSAADRRMLEEMGVFQVLVRPVGTEEVRRLLLEAAASESSAREGT